MPRKGITSLSFGSGEPKMQGYSKQIIHMQCYVCYNFQMQVVRVLLLQIQPIEYYSVMQFFFINLFITVFDLPRNIVLCMLHL